VVSLQTRPLYPQLKRLLSPPPSEDPEASPCWDPNLRTQSCVLVITQN